VVYSEVVLLVVRELTVAIKCGGCNMVVYSEVVLLVVRELTVAIKHGGL
jgi:hypothetical protein